MCAVGICTFPVDLYVSQMADRQLCCLQRSMTQSVPWTITSSVRSGGCTLTTSSTWLCCSWWVEPTTQACICTCDEPSS